MDKKEKKEKWARGSAAGSGAGVSAAVLGDARFAHVYKDPRFKVRCSFHTVSAQLRRGGCGRARAQAEQRYVL